MPLPQPLEIVRKDICFFWKCGEPVEARGLCAKHLKQAQRGGEMMPSSQVEKIRPPCSKCRRNPARWLGLCRSCYCKRWRQTTPSREELLARDRERKRLQKRLTQLAKEGMAMNWEDYYGLGYSDGHNNRRLRGARLNHYAHAYADICERSGETIAPDVFFLQWDSGSAYEGTVTENWRPAA